MATTLLQWSALARELPASNHGDDGERGTNPIPFHGLSTGDIVHFTGVMPQQFDAGASLFVRVHCTSTDTAGNFEIETAIDRIGTTLDIDGESYDTAINSGDEAINGTSGVPQVISNEHTTGDVDGLQPGELFRLKITRTTPSTDDATGDLQILAVDIQQD